MLLPATVGGGGAERSDGERVSRSRDRWRQQFDWAVVEWNRDNVFEHPALRNLPDGDLSGLRLSYEETRTNCIAMDSTTYDPIGWSCLRIWEESGGAEHFHKVALEGARDGGGGYDGPADGGVRIAGDADCGRLRRARLAGSARELPGDGVGHAREHRRRAGGVHQREARRDGGRGRDVRLRLTYTGRRARTEIGSACMAESTARGRRAGRLAWAMFSGGVSPARWRVDLDFGNLTDTDGQTVTTTNVRRMRWTWAADLQFEAFERSEFEVVISNWQVSGNETRHRVAGPGSRRIEDDCAEVVYSGHLDGGARELFGRIDPAYADAGRGAQCTYSANAAHRCISGRGTATTAAPITVQVDGGTPVTLTVEARARRTF